jgi:glycosyltransferase involved in cell wall biosynthesis
MILTACRFTADAFARAGITAPIGIVPVPVPPGSFGVPDWHPAHRWKATVRHVAWGGEEDDPHAALAAATSPAEPRTPGIVPRIEGELRRRYHRHVRPWLSEATAQRVRRAKNRLLRRPEDPAPPRIEPRPLRLSGLVYTSIFNLGDPRKNPRDLLSAFLVAFRDRPDVTLVLKLASNAITERTELEWIGQLHRSLGIEHRCRVVVVTDYLTEDQLDELYRVTAYYVNTSHAEGACLPLQRALASGRPGIAAAHTSMSDYLDETVGLVVASHDEPAPWPHDPEQRCETTRHRLVWASLRDQFERSAALAEDPAAYRVLAAAGRARMERLASRDASTVALRRALRRLNVPRRPGAVDWAA